LREPVEGGGVARFKHIGLYIYRRNFLLRYPGLAIGPLERAEQLEQMRALESGFKIRVVETDYESLGVDTPADLERVRRLVQAGTAAVRRQEADALANG
jgi:3-deoxy-manno-octulosonate cytidylyltransferase (CMP-KDO synthetase)